MVDMRYGEPVHSRSGYGRRDACGSTRHIGATWVLAAHMPLDVNPPTSLSTDNETASTIDVSWTAPFGGATITGYTVEWRTGSDAYETADVDEDTTEYTITGLDVGTAYDIRVRANAAGGSSEYATTTASDPECDIADVYDWGSNSEGSRQFELGFVLTHRIGRRNLTLRSL